MEQETTTTLSNSKLVYTQERKVLEKESPVPYTPPIDLSTNGILFHVVFFLCFMSIILMPVVLYLLYKVMKSDWAWYAKLIYFGYAPMSLFVTFAMLQFAFFKLVNLFS